MKKHQINLAKKRFAQYVRHYMASKRRKFMIMASERAKPRTKGEYKFSAMYGLITPFGPRDYAWYRSCLKNKIVMKAPMPS